MKQPKKKKQTGGGKGNDVVAVDPARMKLLRDYKAQKGTPIVFFIAQAIDNEFKRLKEAEA